MISVRNLTLRRGVNVVLDRASVTFNHLDLAKREALAMALNEFEGTVMLVSHDRALLRAVCDEFWLVTKGGVEPFDDDLDDYQQFLRDEGRRLREQAAAEQKAIG
jgi:ATP-binding cassette subfamily F protein 3